MPVEADDDRANAIEIMASCAVRPGPRARRDRGGGDMDASNRQHV